MSHEYATLKAVLDMAFKQASEGKGKERHVSTPGQGFENQPICNITRAVGFGFPLGQAMKKIEESTRMDTEAAVKELLGAIVYIAGAIVVHEEQRGRTPEGLLKAWAYGA